MKKFLFYFAVTGWTSGLIVHLFSLAGVDITNKVPFVWLLHIGIFVVWIPVMFYLKKDDELTAYQRSGMLNRLNSFGLFRVIFRHAPKWMKVVALAGFFYAIINFILFMMTQPGTPDIKDGQYILHSHGTLLRILTEQEYHHYRANEIRGFSGHWLAFYGAAAAILFPISRFHQNVPVK